MFSRVKLEECEAVIVVAIQLMDVGLVSVARRVLNFDLDPAIAQERFLVSAKPPYITTETDYTPDDDLLA